MGTSRKLTRVAAFVFALVLTIGASTQPAAASTTGFDSATADLAWSKGKITGSVTWDSCPVSSPSSCRYWKPYLVLQPASPSSSCVWKDDWTVNGSPSDGFLWVGDTQYSPGTKLTFDLRDADLISDVQRQRVCLVAFIGVTVIRNVPDPYCEYENRVLEFMGISPYHDCIKSEGLMGEVIGQADLRQETAVPPTSDRMSVKQAVAIAKRKLADKYGRSWRNGRSRRVTCKKKPSLFVCSASWKFKRMPRMGSVRVYKP